MGSVEFTDGAGDVGPILTVGSAGEKTFPGFDVVKLSIVSDGKQITVATTLNPAHAEVTAPPSPLTAHTRPRSHRGTTTCA